MEITLEKIELVKDRTGVSYKEAKEAFEAGREDKIREIKQKRPGVFIPSLLVLFAYSHSFLRFCFGLFMS